MTEGPLELIIHTDGASRGNPGDSGIGFVFFDAQGKTVKEDGRYLGLATNNVAEYTALLEALKEAATMGAKKIHVRSDSELMVKQINGQYRVKNEGLIPIFNEVKKRLVGFPEWEVRYVPREKNRRADELANQGIDRHFS